MFTLSMSEEMKAIILAGLDCASRDLGRQVTATGSGISGETAMKLIAVHNAIVAVQGAPAAATDAPAAPPMPKALPPSFSSPSATVTED